MSREEAGTGGIATARVFSPDIRLPTSPYTTYYGAPWVLPRALDLVPPERLVPPAGDEQRDECALLFDGDLRRAFLVDTNRRQPASK